MSKKLLFSLALAFVAALFWCFGYGPARPIRHVSMAELFPPADLARLTADSSHQVFAANLCARIPLPWDSLLVIKAYTEPYLVRALPFNNYGAIRQTVKRHYMDESICTAVFVYQGRYVGIGLLPRDPVEFSTIDSDSDRDLSWITKTDCARLRLLKVGAPNATYYYVKRP